MRVGIVCPCRVEYDAIVDGLELAAIEALGKWTVSTGKVGTHDCVAVFSGFGKIGATAAAQTLLDRYKANILLDIGAAGAISNDLDIGDIVLTNTCYEYDLLPDLYADKYRDLINTQAMLDRRTEAALREACSTFNASVYVGGMACGELAVEDSAFREKLADRTGAIACNWETSSVLRVARMNNAPSLSIRTISDLADESMQENLKENWAPVMKKLAAILRQWLEKSENLV